MNRFKIGLKTHELINKSRRQSGYHIMDAIRRKPQKSFANFHARHIILKNTRFVDKVLPKTAFSDRSRRPFQLHDNWSFASLLPSRSNGQSKSRIPVLHSIIFRIQMAYLPFQDLTKAQVALQYLEGVPEEQATGLELGGPLAPSFPQPKPAKL